MKRLTYVKCPRAWNTGRHPTKYTSRHTFQEIVERLAAYEDAEEQGRLVVVNTSLGEVSDGYHTFNELYHHRAVLFSVICNHHPDIAWKSKRHDNDNDPMYDGMFICGITTPAGQATYHYDLKPYWDMFRVPELERAPVWDGHTPSQAIERIAALKEMEADNGTD